MSSDLFKNWLKSLPAPHQGVALYTERPGARAVGLKALKGLLADHFVGEATILRAGGYKKAAAIIINSLPSNKKTQSGDLGELLATEYLNAETPFAVPIKKLRWKSDRQMAMHGNDVIGVDTTKRPVRVLKGECKSRATFGNGVVAEAAASLDLHDGRPNPSTLAFIAKRLYEEKRDEEALRGQRLLKRGVAFGLLYDRRLLACGSIPLLVLLPLAHCLVVLPVDHVPVNPQGRLRVAVAQAGEHSRQRHTAGQEICGYTVAQSQRRGKARG